MTVEDAQLAELLAERDIRRVIFRYARGVDRRDWDLVASCYHADAFESHGSFGRGPVAAFIEWAREKLEQYVSSTHLIGNVLIEIDGDRASAESYCLGIHRHAGDELNDGERPHDAVANVRYIDRFERRDGVWRISERVCMFDPGRVDAVETDYPIAELAVRGVAGSKDASYDVLP